MKKMENYKIGFIVGIVLIVIAILIGLIFQHDIAFVFGGLGIVSIGVATLLYINKGNQ